MGLALKKILDDIGDILIKDLRRELKNQEYFASGSLDNSLNLFPMNFWKLQS